MFRSLHRKLVLILVLLIVSVMAVVGTFLINSINTSAPCRRRLPNPARMV